jgi:hypothetical protein
MARLLREIAVTPIGEPRQALARQYWARFRELLPMVPLHQEPQDLRRARHGGRAAAARERGRGAAHRADAALTPGTSRSVAPRRLCHGGATCALNIPRRHRKGDAPRVLNPCHTPLQSRGGAGRTLQMTLRLSLLATALLVAAAPAFASSPTVTGTAPSGGIASPTRPAVPAPTAGSAAVAPATQAQRPAATGTPTTGTPAATVQRPASGAVQAPASGAVQAPMATPAAPRVN